MFVHQQLHAYRNGHQLIASSLELTRDDQDAIDRLSDLAGPLAPGEVFPPYLTTYPLPSGTFYVVARTWQDLAAPRSGCVVTRSLILPTTLWASMPQLWWLVEELSVFDEEKSRLSGIVAPDQLKSFLPPVFEAMCDELSEALFLEDRQPIVVFSAISEELVAMRLLQALWPGMRKVFSICTRAYSPRQLTERAFDLLFAPAEARTNFSGWTGRKIDGSAATSFTRRHRWTEEISRRIFVDPNPHAFVTDPNEFLTNEDATDEAALRMSLLWKDLIEKANTSPMAILGMIDILASQRKAEQVMRSPQFEQAVQRAVHLASQQYSALEFFEFLATFFGKFPRKLPPTRILRLVRTLTAEAAKNSDDALDFLQERERRRLPIPAVIAAGIGDGLAHSRSIGRHLLRLMRQNRETLLLLIAFSRFFARGLVLSLEEESDPSQFDRLAQVVSTQDPELRARATRYLIPSFNSHLEVPVLESLLSGIGASALSRTVRMLWRANRFGVEEFDVPLRNAANDAEKLSSLRTALAELPFVVDVDRALLHTLSLTNVDIKWILISDSEYSRKSYWLTRLVEQAPDWTLKREMSTSLIEVVLNELKHGLPASALAMSRLLSRGAPSVECLAQFATVVSTYLRGHDLEQLVLAALGRCLSEGRSQDNYLVETVFDKFALDIRVGDLVLLLTAEIAPPERIVSNLEMVARSSQETRMQVASRIDDLTEQLVRRRDILLSPAAIDVWTELIQSSGDINAEVQFRAASRTLDYCLQRPKTQVSRLIVATFPIVYRKVAHKHDVPLFFQLLPFIEWDQSKVMRLQMVSAFLNSSWPPEDLLLIAYNVDELDVFLDSVKQNYQGAKYLAKLRKRIDYIPANLRSKFSGWLSDETPKRRKRG